MFERWRKKLTGGRLICFLFHFKGQLFCFSFHQDKILSILTLDNHHLYPIFHLPIFFPKFTHFGCCITLLIIHILWYTDIFEHKGISRIYVYASCFAYLAWTHLCVCVCVCVQVFQQELPEMIQDTWDNLTEEPDRVPESRWRYVSPKSLLDNFCHTMHCLFSECFASTEAQQDCEYHKGYGN